MDKHPLHRLYAGGVAMCRHNILLGCILTALGLGLLIGNWAGGGFLFHCLGLGLLLSGCLLLRKK